MSGRRELPWQQRLLQHALLLPVLAGCYCTAVRIGWTPARRRVPQQLALALGFALLMEWALLASEELLHVTFGMRAVPFGIITAVTERCGSPAPRQH
jgi:hypothetical protein